MRKTDRFEDCPFIYDKFDVNTIPGFGDNEIRLYHENKEMLFRKITPSPLDLYLLDPEFILYPYPLFFNPEMVLYRNGNKLVHHKNPKEHRIEHRTFNDDGLLVRQQNNFKGTCHDRKRVTEVIDWLYYPKQLTIFRREVEVPEEERICSISQYKLDRSLKIERRADYCRAARKKEHDLPIDVERIQGMSTLSDITYAYDEKARIGRIEIDQKHGVWCGPHHGDKISFVYDDLDRIIRRQIYDIDNRLDEEEVIEYLNEKQISVNLRYRIYEFDDADLRP